MGQPFFSIGVTTYNRPRLLKRALDSILAQSFTDFEVIVGNDFTEQVLKPEDFGISDPRVRFFNYEKNLGELKNMNRLLELSVGRYFTWQADDDLYDPEFLSKVYSSLKESHFPLCAFTSYKMIYDRNMKPVSHAVTNQTHFLKGSEFLNGYLGGRYKVVGTCGLFDRKLLQSIGGVEQLSETHFALYSEYLLLVKMGLLDKIVFVDEPLVHYYHHNDSWGCSNSEIDLYKVAGIKLIEKSVEVLRSPALIDQFEENLRNLMKIATVSLIDKIALQIKPDYNRILTQYLRSLEATLDRFKGKWIHQPALLSVRKAEFKAYYYALKTRAKAWWRFRKNLGDSRAA